MKKMMTVILELTSCLFFSACASGSGQESAGNAPKEIQSHDLQQAKICFDLSDQSADDPRAYAEKPPGWYELSLAKTDAGAAYHAICRRGGIDGTAIIDLQFSAPASALTDLENLIREKRISQINGLNRVGSSVKGTAAIEVVYGSGETIRASAEGGANLPAEYFSADWFVDFFRQTAQSSGQEFCNPLIKYANPTAVRTIVSQELVTFQLTLQHSQEEEPDAVWPTGHYRLQLAASAGEAICTLWADAAADAPGRQIEFAVDAKALADLQTLLNAHRIAKLNGYSRIDDPVLTQLWLSAEYASGENILAIAEGNSSDVKPYVGYADSWFLNFFGNLAEQYGQTFPLPQ